MSIILPTNVETRTTRIFGQEVCIRKMRLNDQASEGEPFVWLCEMLAKVTTTPDGEPAFTREGLLALPVEFRGELSQLGDEVMEYSGLAIDAGEVVDEKKSGSETTLSD